MKKLLLSIVALLATVAASAQVYVGGEVGLWRNFEDNHTSFTIAPQIGYNINEKWAVGLDFAYAHEYYDGIKVDAAGVAPYARYTVAKAGPVSFLLDGGVGFLTYKYKVEDYDSDSYNSWQIGISPGIKVSLTKKVDFIASLGFLGYRDNDDDFQVDGEKVSAPSFGEKGFGFSFSSNDLKFGVVYNF